VGSSGGAITIAPKGEIGIKPGSMPVPVKRMAPPLDADAVTLLEVNVTEQL